MTANEEENVRTFIDNFTKITVRISSFSKHGEMTGRSSGFLFQSSEDAIPLVVTAGHKLPAKGSFIETRVSKEHSTLSINAGEFRIFYNGDDIDYAVSELPTELYRKEIEQYNVVDFFSYRHKFVPAVPNEAYGFAVINNYEFTRDINGLILPTYCCVEVGMELVEQTERLNIFKLARPHQGDEYYQGASGAPIADPEGQITSILIGRVPGTELLKASRLDNVDVKEILKKTTSED